MITLGIDPGYARLGWAILDHHGRTIDSCAYGIIETNTQKNLPERLTTIYEAVSDLIANHQPTDMAIEDLYFAKNEKTALLVAQARGVILLAGARNNLTITTYNPLVVKQTICGNAKAEKKQIQTMVKLTLKLATTPQPDDVADAIALAITHAMRYTFHTKTV